MEIAPKIIIAIDGYSSCGKSTMAKALAKAIGYLYIDSGAMYRAVALAGKRRGLDWDVPTDLADLARKVDLRVMGEKIFLDGEDVTEAVRTSEVTAVTRYAADNPEVRAHLVRLQQALAGNDDVVTEGRDQGTVAFPNAQCKIFLTAGPEERALRRWHDLQRQGEPATLAQVLAAQQRRDSEDAGRAVGPLVPASDAIEVCTDGLSLAQVVDKLESLIPKP